MLHHDYESEPTIEMHVGRPVDKANGNLLHAKNPRRLQFASGGQTYEITMHERCHAPRNCLLNRVPQEPKLDDGVIGTIVRWTANRYLRSAFPDEFNKRINAAKKPLKRLESALKRDGDLITGIFLMVDPPDEIGPEEQYRVIMRLTAKEEVFDGSAVETTALKLTETVRSEFNSIDGIELVDYQLVSEADFSLADVRTMQRWDYDYLTYRGAALDQIAPAG